MTSLFGKTSSKPALQSADDPPITLTVEEMKELEAISLEQTDDFDRHTFYLPNTLAEAWKAKATERASWTIDFDIQPPDNLAVEAKTKPSYIT